MCSCITPHRFNHMLGLLEWAKLSSNQTSWGEGADDCWSNRTCSHWLTWKQMWGWGRTRTMCELTTWHWSTLLWVGPQTDHHHVDHTRTCIYSVWQLLLPTRLLTTPLSLVFLSLSLPLLFHPFLFSLSFLFSFSLPATSFSFLLFSLLPYLRF